MTKTKQMCVLIVAAALSGCATIGDMNRLNPDPVFSAPDESVNLTAPVSSALKIEKNGKCENEWVKDNLSAIPSDVERFTAAMACAIGGKKREWARFAEIGKLLADRQCAVFLDGLEDRRVHVGYNQNNMNVVVAAASAILAKGGHHAQSVFNLATGATAANALVDSYKSNYVMTNSIHQLKQKIIEGQKVIGDPILTNVRAQGFKSFDDAKEDLLVYSDWCTHKTLVFIVNETLSHTKITAKTPESELAEDALDALFAKAKETESSLAGTEIAEDEFSYLHAMARLSSVDRKELIAALNAVETTGTDTGKNGWETKLKSVDLGKLVNALKLGTSAEGSVVSNIKKIGRALGFDLGKGNEQWALIQTLSKKQVAVAADPPSKEASAKQGAKRALSAADARAAIRITSRADVR